MQVCPSCGEENPDRFRVCGICAAPLATSPSRDETRKTVTVVFSDLKGSTNLGERLDSESLREVMTRYFDEMRRVLEHHGGTVEKFIGDAVMAVFGLPRLHEDDALRAVRATADMQQALATLNVELQQGWGVTLENRTGVNTGEVVAGDVATGQRLVTGDAVNVAARLEQAAPPMEVLLGESTYRLVRDAVEAEPVPPLDLKGKAEPVTAYRMVAVRRTELILRHLDAPMVGRAAEAAELLEALDRAMEGRVCQLVTVIGPAGVGKSRLVEEVVAQAARRVRVVRGRCLPYGDGITFWPLGEVVRDAAGITDESGRDAARDRLARLLPGEPDGEEIIERIGASIGVSPGDFPIEETFWASRKLFEILGRDRPLVVVFDDIHWAEESFLGLIEDVAVRTEGAPVLLVCMARPELLDERPTWGTGLANAAMVSLRPLSEEETAAIVDNLMGGVGLPDEVRARVSGAAEGNPLFVEQYLSMLMDDDLLVREDGRWVLRADLASLPAPPNILALLASRLDRLPFEERVTAERASVIGLVFYEEALRSLTPGHLEEETPARLAALARKELIRPEESTFVGQEAFRFHHLLVRDAAYSRLLKRSRADLHERFVEWLEGAAGSRLVEYEEVIGYHLEQAYRYRAELGPLDEQGRALAERAAGRLMSAGRRAFARGDMPAAGNLLGRAAGLLPEDHRERLVLAPDLGEALMDIGEFGAADALLTEAIERATVAGDRRMETHARLGRLLVRYSTDPEGWTDEVLREAEEAIPALEAAGDHEGLAKAWRLMGSVHGTACRYGAAEQAVRRAAHHARLAGDRRQEMRNLGAVAMCALYGPMPVPAAIERCEQVIGEAAGDRRTEGLVLVALAHLRAMQGDFEAARRLYRRSRAVLEDLGGKVLAASTSLDSGPIEMLAGDPQAAERELRGDYETLREMGEKYLLSTTAALLAQALDAQGKMPEAERLSRESEEAAAPDDIESQVLWRCVRGRIEAGRGRIEEGERLLREALALVERTEEPQGRGEVLTDLAQVLLLSGRTEEASAALREAGRLFDSKGNLVSAGRAESALRRLI